ncbi:acyl carrier protein [Blastopirellula sp. JC732]|uniref:Acyl carrier protein n=1 Tax=Blastopirellula sediminis TaxID=2894196 RepID=A0A9X1MJT2_9BACT|nr:acyl carrier protein [Blastopirellula sediminis]MCC9608820.1 acyl carrier protein [Blastopirellula sediminis]MCC9628403.1 acyl carrier protein [Blastopirellula sediminis]
MGTEANSPPPEVFTWLRKEIAERRQIRIDLIQPESSLAEDLIPDSFELIELATAVEQHFGVRIDFDEVADIDTLGDFSALIESKR